MVRVNKNTLRRRTRRRYRHGNSRKIMKRFKQLIVVLDVPWMLPKEILVRILAKIKHLSDTSYEVPQGVLNPDMNPSQLAYQRLAYAASLDKLEITFNGYTKRFVSDTDTFERVLKWAYHKLVAYPGETVYDRFWYEIGFDPMTDVLTEKRLSQFFSMCKWTTIL